MSTKSAEVRVTIAAVNQDIAGLRRISERLLNRSSEGAEADKALMPEWRPGKPEPVLDRA